MQTGETANEVFEQQLTFGFDSSGIQRWVAIFQCRLPTWYVGLPSVRH